MAAPDGATRRAPLSEAEWALARARMVQDQLERRGLGDDVLLR